MKIALTISQTPTTTDATNSAELFGWGEPLYRSDLRSWMNNVLIVTFGLLALSFAALTTFGLVEFIDKREYGAWFVIIFCGLVTFGALKFIAQLVRRRNDWVAVYERGIGARYWGKELALPWSEVESVVQNLQTIRVNLIPIKIRNFIVASKSGGNYTFGNTLRNIEDVGALMQQCATARLLPNAITAYERGETLAFSNLKIDQHGLHLKKKSLAWSELDEVKMGYGALVLRKQGKRLNWASVSTNLTPNIFVLIGLFKHLGKL